MGLDTLRPCNFGLIGKAVTGACALLSFATSLCIAGLASAEPEHGFAIYSELQRSSDFEHFGYVEPSAPKGGVIRQGTLTSFNTTNRMRFPGKAPNELRYIHDTLMVRALDEPASYYGLLAEKVEIAHDFSEARFTLRSGARWQDGERVTADDVVFTFETLARYGLPLHRTALKTVTITAEDSRTVLFRSDLKGDWTFLDLVSTFPIHPKHFWSQRDVDVLTMDVPFGSGPYRVTQLAPGDRVVLTRRNDYWGKDLPVNRGLWNFDRIETIYFRDETPLIEAVRSGFLDVHRELDAMRWSAFNTSAAIRRGDTKMASFPKHNGGLVTALVFNQRRSPLDNASVRAALTLAFDGDWTRRTLFNDLYDPPDLVYAILASSLEETPTLGERALLEPYLSALPDGVFVSSTPSDPDQKSKRERLRQADKLLQRAGFIFSDGRRVNVETGEPLKLSYVGTKPSMARVLAPYAQSLELLGISLDIQFLDYVLGREAILSHKFDLTVMGVTASFPPGKNERVFWHSERADQLGYALAGAKDPALDAAIDAMTFGADLQSISDASRAFERILRWRYHLMPLWQTKHAWVVHKADLRFPKAFIFPGFHFIPYMYQAP